MRNEFGRVLLREHNPCPNSEALGRNQTLWIVMVVVAVDFAVFFVCLTADRNHNTINHRSQLAGH